MFGRGARVCALRFRGGVGRSRRALVSVVARGKGVVLCVLASWSDERRGGRSAGTRRFEVFREVALFKMKESRPYPLEPIEVVFGRGASLLGSFCVKADAGSSPKSAAARIRDGILTPPMMPFTLMVLFAFREAPFAKSSSGMCRIRSFGQSCRFFRMSSGPFRSL